MTHITIDPIQRERLLTRIGRATTLRVEAVAEVAVAVVAIAGAIQAPTAVAEVTLDLSILETTLALVPTPVEAEVVSQVGTMRSRSIILRPISLRKPVTASLSL